MAAARGNEHIIDTMMRARRRRGRPAGRTGKDRRRTGKAPAPAVDPLSRAVADSAVRCVEAYMMSEREEVVQSSVAYLRALCDIWSQRKIDARDVWREVDGRLQVSALLNRLNRQRAPSVRVKRKLWRPSSTKLP
ncbi:hypothetical protein N5W20_03530 [Candidatus Kirkpatrickella diaphorinae]|uniref:Uncharacterized protein n=1 Tax=Candidatus Kirkpatrickella diaphorinae TaxID=2984322 RepID=A0ABY6GK84_9PROT|nr:hypothetical protein [Candidatus Kirkpatrickella diaphorinae]UYH51941.1 hypothetical protein N5W20_03530 [Candidatus Kirkpatrickella diaphorinae]